MADTKATIYEADPHTLAKHQILREYLKRWLPILARQSRAIGRQDHRLLYVDGFAGAGEYTGGIPGSPLVAIEAALAHVKEFQIPVDIRLIELRSDRVKHLKKLLDEKRSEIEKAGRIILADPVEGDCEQQINSMIDEHERTKRPLGPALFFLDQFGYSSFSMALVGRILKHEVCEVFSYLNWNLLHPFMSDPTKHEGITRAFGSEEWRSVLGLSGKEKEDRFREIYLEALRNRAGAKYAYPFAMRDRNDRVIYWLFFCSNNLRGLEEMKRAMWTVDRSGGFEFSDKFASQVGQMFSYDDTTLAKDLTLALHDKTLTVQEIQEYVLVNTPACNFKNALKLMERTGRLKPVSPPAGRRACTFTDMSMRVTIRQAVPQESSMLFDS